MKDDAYIELCLWGKKYRMELDNDTDADELKNSFSRLLVCAGFSPMVIDAEGGEYTFVADDEKIVNIKEDE